MTCFILAYSNYLIAYLDSICEFIFPDVVPVLFVGDSFFDAIEKALLHFLRDGVLLHVLGLEPYLFRHQNRAISLLSNLIRKS